jgi:hypothetical protein
VSPDLALRDILRRRAISVANGATSDKTHVGQNESALTLIADIPRGHGFQLQWAIRSRHKDWRDPLTTGVMKSD